MELTEISEHLGCGNTASHRLRKAGLKEAVEDLESPPTVPRAVKGKVLSGVKESPLWLLSSEPAGFPLMQRDLLPADPPPPRSHRLVTHTLLADADVEDTGARAVPWRHTEASVVRVDRRVGEHHHRGHEAVGWDARHRSRAIVHQEQRPARRSQTQGC